MTTNKHSVYNTEPTVKELNKVSGFDPLRYLREADGEYILDLPYKKLWFRLKYPNGIIKYTLVRMTADAAIVEARVFFDRRDKEAVSAYITSVSSTSDGFDYLKAAQNEAADHALSDAGFGIQFISGHNTEHADKKTKIVPLNAVSEKAAYTEDMDVEHICSLMTVDEAENYIVKEGTCAGWTMADVAQKRPASLKYYVTGYQGKDNILRAAAKLLISKAS